MGVQLSEVSAWVRQFADEIAAEKSAGQKALLLAHWKIAHEREYRNLQARCMYEMRAQGMALHTIASVFGVERHTVGLWADDYASSAGLPSLRRSYRDMSDARQLPSSSR